MRAARRDHDPAAGGGAADWSMLMARAQTGDRDAYRALLEAVLPYLRALVRRHAVLAGEVEDTVQDILLTLHRVRATYDPRRPFGPWLVAIARRRIIDRLRQRGSRAAVEVELGPEHETSIAAATNDHAGDESRGLRAAIATLPPGQRVAITLLKLREMSLKEAATVTGMSVPALKVATHRALRTLRVRLAGKE
jgi:RNA polymerase sigma-70 factor (ECF subfamily)